MKTQTFLTNLTVYTHLLYSCHSKWKLLITLLLLAGLRSPAQDLEGYYGIAKRESGVGGKDVFHFRADSSFRYQSHSVGRILVGEGKFRKHGDTLFLYFEDCQTCRVDTSSVVKVSTAPEKWIYLKKLMPWGIDIWGVQDEVLTFTVRPASKNQVIFANSSSVTRYRRLRGSVSNISKRSFSRYFID